MVELIYHPSPLEEAYGIYLLETVFGRNDVAAAAAADTDDASSSSSFSISGRQAVPFLSQAQTIGRDVLREIWSAVDPTQKGRLTSPLQFHVILRLIALGQAGLLASSSAVTPDDPQEALRLCLLQTATRTDVPLAVFDGYPIPDQAQLRALYFERKTCDSLTAVPEPAMTTTLGSPTGVSTTIDEAFGGLVDVPDAPLPPLMGFSSASPAASAADTSHVLLGPQQQQQQQPSQQPTSSRTTSPHPTTSFGWDAADTWTAAAAVPSDGIPDSAAQPPPEPVTNNEFLVDGGLASPFGTVVVTGGDWGALDALVDVPDPAPPVLLPSTATTTASGLEADTFGDFGNAPTTSPSNLILKGEDVRDQEDPSDSFGDFAGIDATESTAVVVVPEEHSDSFGDFTGEMRINDAAAIPHQAMATRNDDDDNPSDSFGDFGDAPAIDNNVTATDTAATTLMIGGDWSVLDALASGGGDGEVQDAPLPAIQKLAKTNEGFDASGTDSGGGETTTISEAGWGAFDVLTSSIQDAPLPSLTGPQPSMVNDETSHGEDFGDFVATPADAGAGEAPQYTGPTTEGEWGAFDALSDIQDAPLPTLPSAPTAKSVVDAAPVSDQDDVYDFDVFIGTDDAVDADFGQDFGSNVASSDAAAPAAVRATDDEWGAFDALTNVQDAPLPSLGGEIIPSIANDDGDDNNFGGFVGTGEQTTFNDVEKGQTTEGEWGAFDALAAIQDAPLSTLSPTSQELPSDSTVPGLNSGDRANGLGGFADFTGSVTPAATWETTVVGTSENALESSDGTAVLSVATIEFATTKEDTWGAFDTLVGAQDAPFKGVVGGVIEDSTVITGGTMVNQEEPRDLGLELDAIPADATGASESDDFGDFARADNTTPPLDTADASESNNFGDFAKVNNTATPLDTAGAESDDFCDFAGDDNTPSSRPPDRAGASPSDGFGDFAGVDTAPTEAARASESDGFGDFAGVDQAGPPEAGGASESDGFGDFAGAEDLSKRNAVSWTDSGTFEKQGNDSVDAPLPSVDDLPSSRPQTSAKSTEVYREIPQPDLPLQDSVAFGSFEVTSAAGLDQPSGQAGGDDDFGGFASNNKFVSSPGEVAKKDDNDWDAFQGPSSTIMLPVNFSDVVKEKQMIVARTQQLPEALRRKTDGETFDFGECFDANIGLDTPVTDERKDRLDRASQLIDLLSSSHSNLASTYWAQCFSVARDELSKALQLLQEAKGFSQNDRNHVIGPCQRFLDGLREFVRVARFVTATIGDLLMLEHTALLTMDTLSSSWCSIALVSEALEVETLWRELENCATDLGLNKDKALQPLATLTQIRSSRSGACESCHLDQFTLQVIPFGQTATTTAVQWERKPFMACTANFLAHKCAFYDVAA